MYERIFPGFSGYEADWEEFVYVWFQFLDQSTRFSADGKLAL
jgi:hypothetical protein